MMNAPGPLEAFWRGSKLRNPPPGSLPAVGSKLFLALLAVSPGARSDRSVHNRGLRRSRNGRRRGYDSLRDREQHVSEHTTAFYISKEKACLVFPDVPKAGFPRPSQGASNTRLEQVRPASAFCNSEMSRDSTRKPFASIRALVLGKEAGKITVSPIVRAFAECA